MEWFIVLIVLAIVTVVGHGIWVVLAWLLRGGRPREHGASYEPTVSDDRAATARYLEHLRARGAIRQDDFAQMMRLVAQDVHSAQAYLDARHRPEKPIQDELEVLEVGLVPGQPPPRDAGPAPKAAPVTPPITWVPLGLKGEVAPKTAPAPRGAQVPADAASPGITAARVPVPPAPSSPPAEPRRPFSAVLAAFMAEKNIRWGELIGGLLIICGSTALVISLWSQIEAIPVLKFVIFTAVTAALFGAGLFVHHRWKLPTTGHALLAIPCLLVPLNLLAFAALSPRGPAVGGWIAVVELSATALFGWLTLLAGRVIMANTPKLFAGGVVALSVCSLLTRFLAPLQGGELVGVAMMPVAVYVIVIVIALWYLSRAAELNDKEVKRFFLQLGVQTFACLAPFGLVLFESGHAARSLHLLSPLVCALASPALVSGLFLIGRLPQTIAPQPRVAATSIALVAAAVMVIGVGLSLSMPSRLMPAMLLNALAMIAVSRLINHSATHAAVAVWLAAAWVLAVHLVGGNVTWSADDFRMMAAATLSAATGQALVGPVVAFAGVASWFDLRRRRQLALGYGLSALAFAVISVALATWFGFAVPGDVRHVTWVYAVLAAIAFAAAVRLKHRAPVWASCLLAQAAIVQLLVYAWPLRQLAWPTALMAGASLCAAAAIVLRFVRIPERIRGLCFGPLGPFSVAVSLPAVVLFAASVSPDLLVPLAVRMAWVALLWAAIGIVNRSPIVFAGSQLALLAAACLGTQHSIQGLTWYHQAGWPPREPWIWQTHLLVAGVLCLAWAIVRVLANRLGVAASTSSANAAVDADAGAWRHIAQGLLDPVFPGADRCITAAVVIGLLLLSIWSVLPGVIVEHVRPGSLAEWNRHTHAAGIGSWVLLSLVVVTLCLHLSEGFRLSAILGLLVGVACGLALLATRWEDRHTVTIAWRWLSAIAFVAGSLAFWTRAYWSGRLERPARFRPAREPVTAQTVQLLLFLLFALPAVLLVASFFSFIGMDRPPLPAGMSALWLRISLVGPIVLVALGLLGYGVADRRPAYAVAASILACAVVTGTELVELARLSWSVPVDFVIWLVQLNTLVFCAGPVIWHGLRTLFDRWSDLPQYPREPLIVARAVNVATLVLAGANLWLQPEPVPRLALVVGTLWALSAIALVEWALLRACRPPARVVPGFRESLWLFSVIVLAACSLSPFGTGNWLCFHVLMIGFAVAAGAVLCHGDWLLRRLLGPGWQETFDTASASAGGTVRQIEHDLSCSHCGYNLRGLSPLGRCPECGALITVSYGAATERLTPRWTAQLAQIRIHVIGAVSTFVVLSTLFALRGALNDPERPWWSSAVLLALSGLCMALATWAPRRVLAYAGGMEICLAASIWWMIAHWSRTARVEVNLSNLVNINVIALAIAGVAWLVAESKVVLRRTPTTGMGLGLAFHHTVSVLLLGVVSLLAAGSLYDATVGAPYHGAGLLGWLGWAAAVGLLIACAAVRVSPPVLGGLYVLGLAGLVRIMACSSMSPRMLAWAMSVSLASYVLATMLVWRRWGKLLQGDPPKAGADSWLLQTNSVMACVALGVAFFVSLTHPGMGWRMLIVVTPLLCAVAALLAAREERRVMMHTSAVALLLTTGVLFAWSWIPPDMAAGWLHRAVGLVVVMFVTGVGSAVATPRLAPDRSWAMVVSRCAQGSIVIGVVAMLYVAITEAILLLERDRILPMVSVAVAAMILAMLVMIVCCILFAIHDRFDPLRLKPNLKDLYVYAAEVLAGLLTLHVRASMPWLFSGLIEQYWPILVMGLAFAAVAAGEACDHYGQRVLAQPLGRTGLFLPVVAMLEFFIASSHVHFSLVLLTTGILYAVLAAMRRSIVLGVSAALSLTGSLWYLLYHTPGLALTQHPQLWFIPPSLAVLVAGHLNRDRMRESDQKLLRYACLLAIYLSSSADIFLIGVRNAPWLPLVLAGLSVVGVLVGVATRVRSFLMLGTGFLCLSLLTMIWYATVDLGWTWLRYVVVIILGVAILTMCVLFEKKRSKMNALLDQVRSWRD